MPTRTVVGVSVCLFVCLYVRSHISKAACPNVTQFSAHVTCDRDLFPSDDNTLCTSSFVDDVTFLQNVVKRPLGRKLANFYHLSQKPMQLG